MGHLVLSVDSFSRPYEPENLLISTQENEVIGPLGREGCLGAWSRGMLAGLGGNRRWLGRCIRLSAFSRSA